MNTERLELRRAYRDIAESYEQLAAKAPLCRFLQTIHANRRGETVPCRCGTEVLDSTPA